jgi:3D (Asp-Asp-Asp) domain-containing protein
VELQNDGLSSVWIIICCGSGNNRDIFSGRVSVQEWSDVTGVLSKMEDSEVCTKATCISMGIKFQVTKCAWYSSSTSLERVQGLGRGGVDRAHRSSSAAYLTDVTVIRLVSLVTVVGSGAKEGTVTGCIGGFRLILVGVVASRDISSGVVGVVAAPYFLNLGMDRG